MGIIRYNSNMIQQYNISYFHGRRYFYIQIFSNSIVTQNVKKYLPIQIRLKILWPWEYRYDLRVFIHIHYI